MRLEKLWRSSRGDTIVEVLVVLAVLGLSLSISYATAARSLNGARQAQEHTEALEYMQAQIESLRALAPKAKDDPKYDIFNQSGPFCVDLQAANPITLLTNPDVNDYDNYPAACTKASLYHLAVSYDTAKRNFMVVSIWDNVRGTGRDQARLVYRIHPE